MGFATCVCLGLTAAHSSQSKKNGFVPHCGLEVLVKLAKECVAPVLLCSFVSKSHAAKMAMYICICMYSMYVTNDRCRLD